MLNISKYRNVTKTLGGSNHTPPPPYHGGGMSLYVRPRVNIVTFRPFTGFAPRDLQGRSN